MSGTALVPVASSDQQAPAEFGGRRPRADFIAQLIATTTRAPQTRVRRRAEPEVAIAAYGASERCPPTLAGHELKRWL